MNKIGLRYPVYKGPTTQGVIGEAIQGDASINLSEAKLYGDDVAVESIKSFVDGTLTLGVASMEEEIYAELLGHTVDSETGEITANVDDSAPYVGIGFYGVTTKSGTRKFRAVWFPKIQFAEPEDTNATKGETVEFNTPVLVGTIMANDDGNWKHEQTFATEAEAKTYLEGKAGIGA